MAAEKEGNSGMFGNFVEDEIDENEKKCLNYIEESLRILERARQEVRNSNKPSGGQQLQNGVHDQGGGSVGHSSTNNAVYQELRQSFPCFSKTSQPMSAALEFHKAFPGLSQPTTGRLQQKLLPTIKRRQQNRYVPYSSSTITSAKLATWTHNFICLADSNAVSTPSHDELEILHNAGLGKKKIVFKDKNGGHDHIKKTLEGYFPRLKSQGGAFQLLKATSGGVGERPLVPLNTSSAGYSVPCLKEDARASVIYILPMNSNIDITPITVNDLTLAEANESIQMAVCNCCENEIPLMLFKKHKEECSKDVHSPSNSEKEKNLVDSPMIQFGSTEELLFKLQSVFPNYDAKQLRDAASNSTEINEAIEMVLSLPVSITPVIPRCSTTTTVTLKEPVKICTNINEVLQSYQNCKSEDDDTYLLKVDRDEVWRSALSFYKKAFNDTCLLKREFEVQFSSKTGEHDSCDAGAIRMEYFELVREEFNKRIMEGDIGKKVPRKGNPFQFTLFGMFLGHSLLHDGPGYYSFQDWVYEAIKGHDNDDHLLQFITKDHIPLNAGTGSIVDFINELDDVYNQEYLDIIVDNNIQLINNTQWDPTVKITMHNKGLLAVEIIYNELVRKRMPNIKAFNDGLKMTGFTKYLDTYPEICRNIFVWERKILTGEQLKGSLSKCNETEYVKKQSYDFFMNLISNCNNDIPAKIFKFATGLSEVPPWGDKRSISIKFLDDDDTKVYPESIACFNILNLPTVHSSQEAFNKHFLKALELEGVGFSASC